MARITGINSGLDVDALVKASMTTYQSKIDTETQNKKVLEYQQEQYKKIISDAANFYDKYFDILKTGNLVSTNSYQSVSFKSEDDTKVTAKGFAGAAIDNYTVSITQVASKATGILVDGTTGSQKMVFGSEPNSVTLDDFEVSHDSDKTPKENASITIANYNSKITAKKAELTESLNKTEDSEEKLKIQGQLNSLNVTATYSEFSKGIVFTADKMGGGGFTLNDSIVAVDTELKGTITKIKNGVTQSYTLSGKSNIITLDNVQFSLKAPTTDTPISLTGEADITALKDKIISFVNDYNKLLSSINTKIYETRDKDYMPLSDEQKKEMTDDQIEKWETKAQTGLIRKDMDLERITSAMKSAMSTVMSGSGLHLESIGINPIANYAEKNGMFTIDEDKLAKALEENTENIKDLFTREASSKDKSNKGGIFTQLAATLKSEFKLSTSSLSKKAGIDGTSTQYNNTLTESIAKKKTLIEELNDKFSVKETALYKKYSALETALEKLNSQQASLSSMLGTI